MKSLVLWTEENGDRWKLLPRLRGPVVRTSTLSAIVALGVSVAVAEDFVSQSNEVTAAGTSSATQAKCDTSDDQNIPVSSTIEAKVTGSLESAHLKPGKEITAQVVTEWESPGCNLPAGSTLYGHVTDATSSKDPDRSEMAIVFDQGQCDRHAKRPISLTLIGVVAPSGQFVGMHSALPSEVSGAGRNISNAVGNGGVAQDENLNPGGLPRTVHPGIVVRIPKLQLEPHGGPGCSARMISTKRNFRLESGSTLILTMQGVPE
jgi:hypothetical protein